MTTASIIEELWFESNSDAANQTAATSFAAKLAQSQGLKTFPAVAQKILTLFADDQFRVGEVIEALGEDPALAASVLRVANSPFFATSHPVTQMNQAFVRVGTNHVKEIVCAVATMEMFRDVNGLGMQIRDHCAAVAGLTNFLGREFGQGPLDGLFLSGLLHDIGKLLLIESNAIDYPTPSHHALEPDMMHQFEQKRLGYDHAVLAGHIVSSWNFGSTVSKTIAWHHQPNRAFADTSAAQWVALLRLADHIDFILSLENVDYERDINELTQGAEAHWLNISAQDLMQRWPELYQVRNDALSTFSTRRN